MPPTRTEDVAGAARANGASDLARHWDLDPGVVFLNHGSFGACPRAVAGAQAELRARLEREPVRFMVEALEGLLDGARAELGAFLGAPPDGLAFVPNATAGVNAVLRSMPLAPGDALLTTDHAYNACANALRFVAERAGARVDVAELPVPLSGPDEAVDRVLGAVTDRTRLFLLDHVTSPTALVLPGERIVRELRERGVETLVDGAHAPGMIPLNVERVGAAYYTGNCHKWLCAPKGAGFLWVREDKRAEVRPAVISHGMNSRRTDRSRFLLEFDWTGTDDPTAALCVPEALRFVASLDPDGWEGVRRRNRELVLAGRDVLVDRLGLEPTGPDEMVGAICSLRLPESDGPAPASALYADPMQRAMLERFGVQAPIIPWPAHPARLIRISAFLYNAPGQYGRLAEALAALLGR